MWCYFILYTMLCGYPPFNGETDEEIFEQVKLGKVECPKEEWGNVFKEGRNLVE